MMTRDEFLEAAGEIINGQRALDYGPADENHDRIAAIWSVVFGHPVTRQQVILAMVGVKLARLANPLQPDMDHKDTWVDVCGYGALGGEMTSTTELEVWPVEKGSSAL